MENKGLEKLSIEALVISILSLATFLYTVFRKVKIG